MPSGSLTGWISPESTNKYCKRSDLSNEDSVKDFFVFRLLKDLGFSDSEVKLNQNLKELMIGRGRNQEPYRPDYVCYASIRPRLVVEAKATDEIVDEYLYQAQGYAFEINKEYSGDEKPVQFVLMSNGEITKLHYWHDKHTTLLKLDFDDFKEGNDKFEALKTYVSRSKIDKPIKKKDKAELFEFVKPESIQDIKNLFRRCHLAIRSAEGMSPSAAFYEFTKILFVKLDQDRKLAEGDDEIRRRIITGEPLPEEKVIFRKGWIEDRENEGEPNPVDKILFQNLRDHLQEQIDQKEKKRIFSKDEHMGLEPDTIKQIVGMLEHYNLIETNEDLNGRLFETFLNALMRGSQLGQFFTPRSVVKFMIAMAGLQVNKDHIDRVLDGCCGTAGFLVEAMDDISFRINHNQSLSNLEKKRLIDRLQNECLWGIDFGKEPPIARIARINMYLHNDGGSKIYHADGLDKEILISKGTDKELKEDRKELRRAIIDEGVKFNVILTNPPFATIFQKKKENECRILKQYELGYRDPKERKNLRSSLRSSVMFLERYRDLLTPHGKLLIVMEETPLESDKGVNPDVRRFIRENFIVKAIVSLPRNTFVQAESTAKTSILYLVKKQKPDEEQIVPFIETSQNVGHDDSGKPVEEERDLYSVENNSQISGGLIDKFLKWERGEIQAPVNVGINDRLDVKNLMPRRRSLLAEWKKQGYSIKNLADLLEPVTDYVRPKREPSVLFKIPAVHFDGSMTLSEERLGRKFKYPVMKRLHEGDIVSSRIDVLSGATALVRPEFEDAVVSHEFWVFRPKEGVNPYYAWQLLRSEYIRDAFYGYSTGITGRHRVEWNDVNEVEVPLPSPNVQEEVEKRIKNYENHIMNAKNEYSEMETKIKDIVG